VKSGKAPRLCGSNSRPIMTLSVKVSPRHLRFLWTNRFSSFTSRQWTNLPKGSHDFLCLAPIRRIRENLDILVCLGVFLWVFFFFLGFFFFFFCWVFFVCFLVQGGSLVKPFRTSLLNVVPVSQECTSCIVLPRLKRLISLPQPPTPLNSILDQREEPIVLSRGQRLLPSRLVKLPLTSYPCLLWGCLANVL